VEKAQEEFDLADAEKMQEKILSAQFDFTDFLKQMRLLKNMGSLGGIMKLIPGMGNKISSDQLEQGETQLKRVEAMIGSMTKQERHDPDLLAKSPSRRRRIAQGSGHSEKEVSQLIGNFSKMKAMMQQMGQGGMPGMGMPGMGGGMPGMGGGFPGMGGGMPGMGGGFPGMGGGGMPGWRGYGGGPGKKKKKKAKKKKGFGNL
ncbi:MAG: signal recognition particle protein, partial [Cyanobacteria bacterium P01_H01_bin.121]